MALWNTKLDQPPSHEPLPSPGRLADPVPARRDEVSTPVTAREDSAPPAAASNDLLLGPGAEFDGKLTFRGTVRIDATFKGSIVTNDVLVVGEHARIDADITCGTVVVSGEVNGDVRATTSVELRRGAKLRGDVTTSSIAVEKGALLQGAVRMTAAEKAAKAS